MSLTTAFNDKKSRLVGCCRSPHLFEVDMDFFRGVLSLVYLTGVLVLIFYAGFMFGSGRESFDRGVANTKLQNCNKIIKGSIYAHNAD